MDRYVYLAAASSLALAAASSAYAQDATAPLVAAGNSSGAVEEVVVTGSRIARRDFVSASPIVTQQAEQLRDTGKLSVEASLNQLPQFTPAQTERTSQQSGGGRASVSLRGLGQTRNLVLLDGRRLPASDAFGVVDVNIIPPAILSGIETITGGASAVYGSDAISGVVNFRTLPNYSGIRVDAQYGDTEMGGGRTADLSITAGGNFDDGKGNALMSLGYTDRNEIRSYQRQPWATGVPGSQPGSTFIPQGAYVPGANQPSQAAINALFARYGVTGTVARTADFGFNDDGTLFNRATGQNYKGPGYPFINREGGGVSAFGTYRLLAVPATRYSLYSKLNYEFSDRLHVYGQAIYVNSRVLNNNEFNVTAVQAPPSIPLSNPFIPADLRTLLASRADPTAPFTLDRKRFTSLPQRDWLENFDVRQFLLGAGGEVGFKDWKWDIYGSIDRTYLTETASGVIKYSNLIRLLTAADGGASICAGGFNPFGEIQSFQVSEACKSYLVTNAFNTYDTRQNIVEANLTGALFALPADEVRFSITADYRENSSVYTADNLYVFNDALNSPQTNSSSGSTSVKELAGELFIPLVKDQRFMQSLNLNLGARVSDYNLSGSVSTYKAEADWKIFESLLFRGGYQRAIRAPNIGELFLSPQGVQINIQRPPQQGDPCDVRSTARTSPSTAAQVRALCLATGTPPALIDSYTLEATASVLQMTRGNTALKPETAVTKTLGAVWRPTFDNPLFSNLSLSVDYYDISIRDIISTIPGADVVTKCYNRDGSNPTYSPTNPFCTYVQRASDGSFAAVNTPYLNLGILSTTGIDINLDWRFGLGAIGLSDDWGRMSITSVFNNTRSYKTQALPGAPIQDFAGTIGGDVPPEYKALSTVTYGYGPFELGLRWLWIGPLKDRTVVTTPSSPRGNTASYNLFGLNGSWDVTDKLRLQVGVNNLLNTRPNNVARLVGGGGNQLFDIIGRSYFVQATARF